MCIYIDINIYTYIYIYIHVYRICVYTYLCTQTIMFYHLALHMNLTEICSTMSGWVTNSIDSAPNM